jgi:pimeloyl-ACP methyl ester carboxylesterase
MTNMAGRVVIAVLLVGMLLVPPAAADSYGPGGGYASVNRPGPALSVPSDELKAALACHGKVRRAGRNVVLLVPGTNLDPEANFSWNYARALAAEHRPFCTVELPDHALGDVQIAGEYVVHAVRRIARRSGRKVDVIGYSQGGMVPRWALRFWPDTRKLVGDLVGLAPSNHGTVVATAACQQSCPPAHWQQRSNARFIEALNSGAETFRGIDYTVIYTRFDQIVVPNLDSSGSSSLHTGKGRITNVAVQDVCPTDTSDHLAMGSYSAVAYALAIDALEHRGPADPSRISPTICAEPLQPGVAPASFATDYLGLLATIGESSTNGPRVDAEPPLADYVFAAPAPSKPANH